MALDVSAEGSGAQTPFRAYPPVISELKEFFTEVKACKEFCVNGRRKTLS